MADPDTLTLTGVLSPRERWNASLCSIALAVEMVGSRSAFLIMREAFYGTTRFDDFARRVGVSESVTAGRLKDLVDGGLLERRPYRSRGERTRMDYHLTEMGADFFPVLAALMQWGERWRGPVTVTMRHHGCGAPVRTELNCGKGHPLAIGDIDLVADDGPRTRPAAGS
jgi:DNA-binding HxlR family transcriptional regulator